MWKWIMTALLGVALLSGCGVPATGSPTEEAETEVPILPALSPTAQAGQPTPPPTAEAMNDGAEVTWTENPEAIVVLYDEGGGFRLPAYGTQVPLWTLYGDGTVVWSQESEKPSVGFEREVFVGQLSVEQMRELLALVAGSGVRQMTDVRDQMIADAPVARLLTDFNGERHEVTVYPPENPAAPEAFTTVRERLLSLRPDNSQRYDGEAFELRPQVTLPLGELTEDQALLYEWWPFEALPLDELVDGSRLVEGEQAAQVAQFVIDHGTMVKYDTTLYRIGLFADPPRPID